MSPLYATVWAERFPPVEDVEREARRKPKALVETHEMTEDIRACRVEQASEIQENGTAGTSVGALARPNRSPFSRRKEAAPVHRMRPGTACEDSHAASRA